MRVHAKVCDPMLPGRQCHSLLSYANVIEVHNKMAALATCDELWTDMAAFLSQETTGNGHLPTPNASDVGDDEQIGILQENNQQNKFNMTALQLKQALCFSTFVQERLKPLEEKKNSGPVDVKLLFKDTEPMFAQTRMVYRAFLDKMPYRKVIEQAEDEIEST